jgi:hypothetical protein
VTVVPQNLVRCMSPADQRACSPSGRTPAEARGAAVAKDERELQRQVANYLRLLGVWHDQDAMHKRRTGTTGAPDFQFPYRGRYIAWEVKCPWSRSLRPEQAFAREGIERQGGEWRLITTLAEAQAHLREIDARP